MLGYLICLTICVIVAAIRMGNLSITIDTLLTHYAEAECNHLMQNIVETVTRQNGTTVVVTTERNPEESAKDHRIRHDELADDLRHS